MVAQYIIRQMLRQQATMIAATAAPSLKRKWTDEEVFGSSQVHLNNSLFGASTIHICHVASYLTWLHQTAFWSQRGLNHWICLHLGCFAVNHTDRGQCRTSPTLQYMIAAEDAKAGMPDHAPSSAPSSSSQPIPHNPGMVVARKYWIPQYMKDFHQWWCLRQRRNRRLMQLYCK